MAMVCLPLNYVPGWQDLEAALAQSLAMDARSPMTAFPGN